MTFHCERPGCETKVSNLHLFCGEHFRELPWYMCGAVIRYDDSTCTRAEFFDKNRDIMLWIENDIRISREGLTSKNYNVISTTQQSPQQKEIYVGTELRNFLVSLVALINSTLKLTPATEEIKTAAAASGKPRGRPAKTAAPVDDGLGGGDGLEDPAGGDGLETGDGLDDLGGEPAKEPKLDINMVRDKLIALKKKDGDAVRTNKLMTMAIADASKQPIVANIPAAKYKAVYDKCVELLAK